MPFALLLPIGEATVLLELLRTSCLCDEFSGEHVAFLSFGSAAAIISVVMNFVSVVSTASGSFCIRFGKLVSARFGAILLTMSQTRRCGLDWSHQPAVHECVTR